MINDVADSNTPGLQLQNPAGFILQSQYNPANFTASNPGKCGIGKLSINRSSSSEWVSEDMTGVNTCDMTDRHDTSYLMERRLVTRIQTKATPRRRYS